MDVDVDVPPASSPPRVRASIFGERPSPASERPGSSRAPIALDAPDDGPEDDDDDDGHDTRSRSGDGDADTDAFVIRPRISAKQASELTFSDDRPSWRSRFRRGGNDFGSSNLSVAKS